MWGGWGVFFWWGGPPLGGGGRPGQGWRAPQCDTALLAAGRTHPGRPPRRHGWLGTPPEPPADAGQAEPDSDCQHPSHGQQATRTGSRPMPRAATARAAGLQAGRIRSRDRDRRCSGSRSLASPPGPAPPRPRPAAGNGKRKLSPPATSLAAGQSGRVRLGFDPLTARPGRPRQPGQNRRERLGLRVPRHVGSAAGGRRRVLRFCVPSGRDAPGFLPGATVPPRGRPLALC